MPSIRQMKRRQVYHHRRIYNEKRFFLHEYPYHLSEMFKGLEYVSAATGDFRRTFECEYGINSMQVYINRVATIARWRRNGLDEGHIQRLITGTNVSEQMVRIQHSGYFVSRLLSADLPAGDFMICDPIEYRRKEEAGEDLTNVTESYDIRVRGKTLVYDKVYYTYRDSKLIFWFL